MTVEVWRCGGVVQVQVKAILVVNEAEVFKVAIFVDHVDVVEAEVGTMVTIFTYNV